MKKANPCGCASYSIVIKGYWAHIKEAVELLETAIDDHSCFSDYLESQTKNVTQKHSWDKSLYEKDDDNGEDQQVQEEYFDVEETRSCVWLEDILALANEIAYIVPDLLFSFSGHIEDSSEKAGDLMDFEITYQNKKLVSRSTSWYICIYMDEIDDYEAFCKTLCDQYGKPRYSEEEYEGFRECANEWFVLDSGQGEFSSNVPMGDPIRHKVKRPKNCF